jgi:hypothetical protein
VHTVEDVSRGQRRRIPGEVTHGRRLGVERARFHADCHETHQQLREAAAAFRVERVNLD